MPQNYLKLGDWNAICDVCGLKFKAGELKKDWRGLMVCTSDFELRHPQDFLRVKGDKPAVPWARPETELETGPACWLWDQSAYAGLGTAGCMQAGYAPLTYLQLYEMKYPPFPAPQIVQNSSAIPGYFIPGRAIPSKTETDLTYGLNP